MTGSLQIKNGKYYAVINTKDLSGKRKQKWICSNYEVKGNKKKAEKFLRDTLKDFESKDNINQCDILFCDYIRYWLDLIKISVDEVTYNCYYWIANTHIIPYFENNKLTLSSLSRSDIQTYINLKHANGRKDGKGGLAPKTLKEHKLIIQSVLKEAVKNDIINKNPCEFVKLPSLKRHEPTFYTQEQISTLLNCIHDEELYPLIYVTLVFGLRRSEVLGLKWDSIDFDRKLVTIKHTVVKYNGVVEKDTTKNKTSYRSYPMNEYIEKLFNSIKESEQLNKNLFGKEYIVNDYVFKWSNGKPYSPDYITSKFSKLLKKNNLQHIRFHDLRHSCASLLIANDYQLKDIQEWLGHADIQTTANIYGHIDIERKKNISNSMTSMFI